MAALANQCSSADARHAGGSDARSRGLGKSCGDVKTSVLAMALNLAV